MGTCSRLSFGPFFVSIFPLREKMGEECGAQELGLQGERRGRGGGGERREEGAREEGFVHGAR